MSDNDKDNQDKYKADEGKEFQVLEKADKEKKEEKKDKKTD